MKKIILLIMTAGLFLTGCNRDDDFQPSSNTYKFWGYDISLLFDQNRNSAVFVYDFTFESGAACQNNTILSGYNDSGFNTFFEYVLIEPDTTMCTWSQDYQLEFEFPNDTKTIIFKSNRHSFSDEPWHGLTWHVPN